MVTNTTVGSGPDVLVTPLPRAFYERPVVAVARDLLGKTLAHVTADGQAAGIIVEAEAYAPDDAASHSYRGQTPRNRTMFGPPGRAYVYRSYGIHAMVNVVTGAEGTAAAVLLRALQPTHGLDLMRQRRPQSSDRDLCRGPGRLCAALGIALAEDDTDLLGPRLWIAETPDFPADAPIAATPRIGITRATDLLWRFVLVGNPYVSGRGVRAE